LKTDQKKEEKLMLFMTTPTPTLVYTNALARFFPTRDIFVTLSGPLVREDNAEIVQDVIEFITCESPYCFSLKWCQNVISSQVPGLYRDIRRRKLTLAAVKRKYGHAILLKPPRICWLTNPYGCSSSMLVTTALLRC